MEHDERHDERWRSAMQPAAEAEPPSPDRLIAALTARGMLGPSRRRRITGPLLAAAAIAMAFLLGTRFPGPAADPGARSNRPAADPGDAIWALLLLGNGDPAVAVDRKIREYGDWAADISAAGIRISGEKLNDRSWTLAPDESVPAPSANDAGAAPPDVDTLTGFFIISAPSADSAIALARRIPHLRYGGRLVVRPIDPT